MPKQETSVLDSMIGISSYETRAKWGERNPACLTRLLSAPRFVRSHESNAYRFAISYRFGKKKCELLASRMSPIE